jgi:hypothetical protein
MAKGRLTKQQLEDLRREIELALRLCWLELQFGAHPSTFSVPAGNWLFKSEDTFRRAFTDFLTSNNKAWEQQRRWLLARSRELGQYCREQAGGASNITLSQTKKAVRRIQALACPVGLETPDGGWCNFDAT